MATQNKKSPIKFEINWIPLSFIVLALGSAIYLNIDRLDAELSNNKVEVVLDYQALKDLSSVSGQALETLLPRFKEAGINSLAIPEDDLRTLEKEAKLIVLSGDEVIKYIRMGQINTSVQKIMRRSSVQPDNTYLIISDTFLFDRVRAAFLRELGEDALEVIGSDILVLKGNKRDLELIGLGFSSEYLNTLSNYNINLIARLNTSGRLDGNRIALKMNNTSEVGVFKTIIFNRDTVLGYPRNLDIVAQRMKRYELNFGWVEFGKQKGAKALAQKIPDLVIKVHSIGELEMKNYQIPSAVQRYVRAVRERNARIVYLRPWLDFDWATDLTEYNLEYIKRVVKALQAAGFSTQSLEKPSLIVNSPPIWARFLIFLGILSLFLVSFQLLYPQPAYRQIFSILFIIILAGISLISPDILMRKIYALILAISAPPMLILPLIGHFNKINSPEPRWQLVLKYAAIIFGGSIIVGIVISALLRQTSFLLAVRSFTGVKLAFVLPLLLVTFYLLFGQGQRKGLIFKVRRILDTPLTISHMLLAGSILLGLSIMILRSGNASSGLLLGVEEKVRFLLESALFVRPRFKEIIIGYPALVFLLHYIGRGINQRWFGLFVLATVLVPINIINSFSHLHTPLFYSFLRSTNGLVVGLLLGYLGIIAWTIVLKISRFIFE